MLTITFSNEQVAMLKQMRQLRREISAMYRAGVSSSTVDAKWRELDELYSELGESVHELVEDLPFSP